MQREKIAAINKAIRILFVFLILIQSMLTQISLPQIVLCLGKDGHVAIETADHREQNPLVAAAADKILIPANYTFHDFSEENCVDISLERHNGDANLQSYRKVFLNQAYSAPFIDIRENEPPFTPQAILADLLRTPSPGLETLRSVVLLI